MEILAGTQRTLADDAMNRMARFRYRVFVEMLGWDLPCQEGIELDQFDREDTLYLLARKGGEEVVGTARLLPTDQPYLLGEVFPQLMGSLPVPRDPEVWELSRFTAIDLESETAASASRQFSSPMAVDLLHSVLKVAAEHGAQRLITASPLGIERLLRRAGFLAHRAASPMVINGHPIFACWIEVPQQKRH